MAERSAFAYGPTARGVHGEDVRQAIRTIRESSQYEGEVSIDSAHIGSRLNEWQRPITEYGSNTAEWEVKLKASQYFGNIDFGRKEWARARDAVDAILNLMMKEIKVCAEKYEGLKIEKYIRQGSSRDGLKVIAPDEFDTLLKFHIEGLQPTVVQLKKNGKIIPEFCQLEISQSLSQLQSRFPKLYREGVFHQKGDTVQLNAKKLHQGVFQSIIDAARDRVMQEVQTSIRGRENVNFRITRSMNPPSVNITIHLDDEANQHFMREGQLKNPEQLVKKIDVDIVPALLIRNDQVPDPTHSDQTMDCPVYAVFKWVEESSIKATVFPNPDIIWRICSSGYEKHTLDLARGNVRQQYITTALRIVKTYFSKTKASNPTPPQIATVLRSYHLKHIAFYLILYLCYLYPNVRIDGVRDVLRYFLAFLLTSLEKKSLPHFFHSNDRIHNMYPSYPSNTQELRFNLLGNKSHEALNQAKLSVENHLAPDIGIFFGQAEDMNSVHEDYNREITRGEFFLMDN